MAKTTFWQIKGLGDEWGCELEIGCLHKSILPRGKRALWEGCLNLKKLDEIIGDNLRIPLKAIAIPEESDRDSRG
jgi:hypothetical protein